MLGSGVAVVRGLADRVHLLVDTAVDLLLLLTVLDLHARHDGNLGSKTGLLLVDLGSGSDDLGTEIGTSLLHLAGGLSAGNLDVLHGLPETHILEGSLGGDSTVEAAGGSLKLLVEVLALLGHGLEELGELGLGPLVGLSHGTGDLGVDTLEALGGRFVGRGDGGKMLGAHGSDVLAEPGELVLHQDVDILGLLGDLVGVVSHVLTTLLDLLAGGGLESEQGALHGADSTIEEALGHLLLGGALLGSSSLLGLSLGEHSLGLLAGSLEVLLSLGSHGLDSIHELLLHQLAGSLGLGAETVDLLLSTLAEGRNLGLDAEVKGSLGLLVEGNELVLGSLHALLTLADRSLHSSRELLLVGLLDGSDGFTATLVLDGVGADNAGQLVELLLELPVVVQDDSVKLGSPGGEIVLGLTETLGNIHAGTAGLLGEVTVDLHLGLLGLGDRSIELGSLLGK